MQISSATLLASQQVGQTAVKSQSSSSGFAQALEKTDDFQPLALKQAARAPALFTGIAQPSTRAPRPGSAVDIKV
jgi:hypothetical protein